MVFWGSLELNVVFKLLPVKLWEGEGIGKTSCLCCRGFCCCCYCCLGFFVCLFVLVLVFCMLTRFSYILLAESSNCVALAQNKVLKSLPVLLDSQLNCILVIGLYKVR